MRRRILALLTVVALIVAACDPQVPNDGVTPTPTSAVSKAASPPATAGGAEGSSYWSVCKEKLPTAHVLIDGVPDPDVVQVRSSSLGFTVAMTPECYPTNIEWWSFNREQSTSNPWGCPTASAKGNGREYHPIHQGGTSFTYVNTPIETPGCGPWQISKSYVMDVIAASPSCHETFVRLLRLGGSIGELPGGCELAFAYDVNFTVIEG